MGTMMSGAPFFQFSGYLSNILVSVDSLNKLINYVKNQTSCMCSGNKCNQDNQGAKVAIAIITEMDVGNGLNRDDKLVLL